MKRKKRKKRDRPGQGTASYRGIAFRAQKRAGKRKGRERRDRKRPGKGTAGSKGYRVRGAKSWQGKEEK